VARISQYLITPLPNEVLLLPERTSKKKMPMVQLHPSRVAYLNTRDKVGLGDIKNQKKN
jgi:hypothetical protein